MIFLKSPITASLLALAVIALAWSLWRKTRGKSSGLAVPAEFKH
jgi:TctA family transporter